MSKENIAILIPALNEELSIAQVIQSIPIEAEVIVINNGSTDRTAEIAEKLATVLHEERKGYGYACLKGISYLSEREEPPDLVIFLDADGADDPNDLLKLLETKIGDEGPDLVLGSRMHGMEKGAMSRHAIWANRVFAWLIRLIYKQSLTDMGPLRVIDYGTLIDIDMQDTGYGWASEMIVKAIKKGYSIKEVPVTYRKRIGVSKISGSLIISIRAAIWISIHIIRHAIR